MLGGGDHARVVLDALLLSGVSLTGVIDPALDVGSEVLGVPVVALKTLFNQPVKSVSLVNGIGGRNDNSRRNEVFIEYKERGFRFVGVTHPSAQIARDCQIHLSVQVMAGSVIQQQTNIEENSVINTACVLEHDCHIGVSSFLGPRVVLGGRVRIDASVFVGAGAVVLPGITLGASSTIGAGAVVTRDVPAGVTVVGNPAREL
jgi:sugar O-acyltransferase (sialic acid O-acetyltransferase NeuD family)